MATAIQEQINAGDDEGKTPDPLPLVGLVAEAAEFPLDAFGPTMRGATEAICNMARVAPALAAASILSATSLALQGYCDVKLPTGAFRPISLYHLTIAPSGARKSASDERAMEPIAEFQRQLNEKYVQEKAKLQIEVDAWNEARKRTIADNKAHGKPALEEALKELGPKPADPMEPVLVTRVGTIQGLMKLMERARPALGLMTDEGGGWLGGYSMTEETRLHTISTLSDFWDGKPVQRLTSGEGGSLLFNRRLTFHLMVQPGVASKLMADPVSKDQGFLSRVLVCQPPNLAGTRFITAGEVVRDEDLIRLDVFHKRLAHILDVPLPFDAQKNALVLGHVWIDRQAEELWVDFFNECEARVGPGGELEEIRGFVGKIAEQAARLAAVLVLFEQGRGTDGGGPQKITADVMRRAILLARFYLHEAARLTGVEKVDPILLDAQVLSEWLRSGWPENLISIRTISQKGPSQLRKLGADRLRLVLDALDRNHHVRKTPNGGTISGKHVQEAWRVTNRERPSDDRPR